MTASIAAHVNDLNRAGALVNVGLDDDAPHNTSAGALRGLVRALRKVIADQDLWTHIAYLATRSTSITDCPDALAVTQLAEVLGDIMSQHHAVVLMQMGYRTPPRPTAARLVDRTRAAVASVVSVNAVQFNAVEEARYELQRYVNDLVEHLPQADNRFIRRNLESGKRLLPAVAMLHLVLGGVSVHTGDELGIDFGASIEHPIEVDVTVPRPWMVDTAQSFGARAAVLTVHEEVLHAQSHLLSES